MNKTTRNIIVIVAIILLLFGIILAVYSHLKAEPMDTNTTSGNVLDDANTGLENLLNDMFNEENENNELDTENKESNNSTNTQTTKPQNQGQSSTNNNDKTTSVSQGTPKEQKAIELVKAEWKKEWGNLNDVSFNNEMIQGDGKYVVSVNDSKTTNVIRRYVVDTTTGVVEERF